MIDKNAPSGCVRSSRGFAEQAPGRLYWLTQEDNTTARLLYDKVARFGGFIRYEHNL